MVKLCTSRVLTFYVHHQKPSHDCKRVKSGMQTGFLGSKDWPKNYHDVYTYGAANGIPGGLSYPHGGTIHGKLSKSRFASKTISWARKKL